MRQAPDGRLDDAAPHGRGMRLGTGRLGLASRLCGRRRDPGFAAAGAESQAGVAGGEAGAGLSAPEEVPAAARGRRKGCSERAAAAPGAGSRLQTRRARPGSGARVGVGAVPVERSAAPPHQQQRPHPSRTSRLQPAPPPPRMCHSSCHTCPRSPPSRTAAPGRPITPAAVPGCPARPAGPSELLPHDTSATNSNCDLAREGRSARRGDFKLTSRRPAESIDSHSEAAA